MGIAIQASVVAAVFRGHYSFIIYYYLDFIHFCKLAIICMMYSCMFKQDFYFNLLNCLFGLFYYYYYYSLPPSLPSPSLCRAFAVVASALGIPSLLPFLKAVCRSKKSWQARHTGIKIIQQIAILMGCAVLPHLRSLVEIIENGLKDEQQKVRTITALGIAALAEAATPYGIESFDSVLVPLWTGIWNHQGKVCCIIALCL